MVRTFKLRYVNEIVGFFVLLCVGLVAAGVVAALRSKEWFQPVLHIKIFLPEEGSMGLRPGNNVQVLGTVIGSVDSINYNTEMGQFEAMVSVRGNLISYLRDKSIPRIHQGQLGIGEPYIEIIKNPNPKEQGEPLPMEGATLWYSEADTGPTEKVDAILSKVQDEVVPLLQQARGLITDLRDANKPFQQGIIEYTKLAADLRDPKQPLQQNIARLNEILSSVSKGESLVGKLLSDPKMGEQVSAMLPKINASLDETQAILKDLRKTSGTLNDLTASAQKSLDRLPEILDLLKTRMVEVQATLVDIRKVTGKMPEIMDGVNQTVQALPGTVVQMQETLRQVQILVEAAQQSWLFRSHVEKSSDTGGRIKLEEIGGGK
jgi:phospholipid/cholesterol/gamma-HCH transport system substrate-binding protein